MKNKLVKKIISVTLGIALMLITIRFVKFLPAFIKVLVIGINVVYFYYYVYLKFKKQNIDE